MTSVTEIARSPLPLQGVEEYAGKWIALRDGEVVAAADTFAALIADERVRSDDAIYHVPETGSCFY